LDTLVVAPAGNDGPAGPGYGSIASPGGAPAALTVGAVDLRRQAEEIPVAIRNGLQLLLDRRLPLAGAVASEHPVALDLTRPGVGVPARVGELAVSSLERRGHPVVSIGLPDTARNGASAQIAPFSWHGLAFDGRVKPDVAAPGVVLATAEAGRNEDGTPRFGT